VLSEETPSPGLRNTDYNGPQRNSAVSRIHILLELRHIRQGKNNSIPIDRGPAQFNAFYPQCSGHDFAS
jgi:hypothetical protein